MNDHTRMTTCSICLNAFTGKLRQKVTCQYCPAHACRICQQQCLLNSYEDPHCFACKRGWSTEFMVANFPISFRNQTLRQHRRTILVEREKSMLPAMQIFVEAKNNIARTQALRQSMAANYHEKEYRKYELRDVYTAAMNVYHPLLAARNTAIANKIPRTEEERAAYRDAKAARDAARQALIAYDEKEYLPAHHAYTDVSRELQRWWRMYDTGEDSGDGHSVREKRVFLMRCPAEDCRGFLSTAYKCGVCEKSTCSECLEVLGLTDAPHTCNPDSVESAKAIKKETRPCPKCAARIFKIEGCDQMWCTVEGCNTAFSWNTGHVVSGRVHNPHYYEWLRRNGGGVAPEREIGDIPCGGLPAAWLFTHTILESNLEIAEKNKLLELHRCIGDFEARLQEYPARRDAMANKEVNVAYLMKSMTEAEWRRELELKEARFIRKKEIGQILQTIVTGASDIMGGVYARISEAREEENVNQEEVRTRFLRARDARRAMRLATIRKKAGLPPLSDTDVDTTPEELSTSPVITWIREVAMPQMEGIRTYTNDAFVKLAEDLHMAVPQISENWRWMPIRALYRPAPKIILPTLEAAAPTEVSV